MDIVRAATAVAQTPEGVAALASGEFDFAVLDPEIAVGFGLLDKILCEFLETSRFGLPVSGMSRQIQLKVAGTPT